jgi:hypothetical protein
MLRTPTRTQSRSRIRPPSQQAGFLLPLASTGALMLLLSSLSLQTAALQARRQFLEQLQQRQQEDRLASAAQQLVGRLRREQPVLLEQPLRQWPATLQQGALGEQGWRLLRFEPTSGGADLQLALTAGGATGAFALVEGELKPLGLRMAGGES